jgi:hypothetical protein
VEEPDRIWNRACDPVAALDARGDAALQSLLLLHGQVMNGGLYSAMYGLTYNELRAAAEAFDYFERPAVADLLRAAITAVFPRGAVDDPEQREAVVDELDEQRLEQWADAYHRLVPTDAAIEAAFRQRLAAAPHDFAPAS